ncbi:MAG: protein translocase subunit SecD [Sandaracinaceae bacterium]|nr:protein translocase subunit SecD [Sandaracinaceae bacterium]
MDRGWYLRLGVVVAAILGALFLLLQTGHRAGWFGDHEAVTAAIREDRVGELGGVDSFFAWLVRKVDRQITPGLDIQGGLRLMYTVDMDAAIEDRQRARAQQLLRRLGERLDIIAEGEAPDEAELERIRARVQAQIGDTDSRLVVLNFLSADTAQADMGQVDHDLISRFGDLAEVSRAEQASELAAGSASAGSRESLTGAGFEPNAFGGLLLEVVSGAAQGQRRLIRSNNATTIRLAAPLEQAVAPGDRFRVLRPPHVRLRLQEESIEELRTVAVNQAQETIKSRIAELGISEANVRSRDIDINVEVPGADESRFQQIRDIISQTARLEFKICDDGNSFIADLPARDLPDGVQRQASPGVQAGEGRTVTDNYLFVDSAGPCPEGVTPPDGETQCTARQRLLGFVRQLHAEGRVPDGRQLALGRMPVDMGDAADAVGWRTYLLYDQPPNGSDAVGGEHLEDASVGTDPQSQQPVVLFSMKTEGARLMAELTQGNLQRRMAVVLDDEVKSAPVIQSRIGQNGQITLGSFRDFQAIQREARDLVIVLRAGALPAPIIAQNEQLIGPTLGQDSVQRGAMGALIGIALVLLFMAIYYEVAGLVADAMVLLNLLLMMAIMAFFNNDLTLPGIAGIALTVGMAVDANVLITERIREELRMGKSARAAVDQGFGRAFWSIFDSQLTTFIAGVVLFQYGSPEIQGFAKTLMIGIATSLFTGVFCSRVMFDWIVRGLRVSRLRVG